MTDWEIYWDETHTSWEGPDNIRDAVQELLRAQPFYRDLAVFELFDDSCGRDYIIMNQDLDGAHSYVIGQVVDFVEAEE